MGVIEEYAREHERWCAEIGLGAAADINRIVDAGGVRDIINISETRHEQELSDIARKIIDSKTRAVFIAGPSSSGKTTAARRLGLHLRALGVEALPISLDDYYAEQEDMPQNDEGKPDYEAFESIDYKRFNENLTELINGHEAVAPAFDFTEKRVISEAKKLRISGGGIIIAEGIHALNPRLADNIPDGAKFRIYCTALCGVKGEGGRRIPSRINRMARRLIRDYYFRSSDYDVTFGLWPNQEKSAEKNIFPYAETADAVFNSSLLYEFGVYRAHLLKILADAAGEYADEAEALRSTARQFAPIDEAAVPGISIAREFIGGSTLSY